jgi:carboxyl-terminal processing protease
LACGGGWQGSIGAILGKDNKDGRLFVREAPADMGAARAGLRSGDEIVAIEGKPAREMSVEQVHQALHGDVGTKVTLTVVRGGVERTLSVERGPLKAADGGT